MAYELDFSTLTLGFLKKRLLEEDLIPSQIPLTRDLDEHIASLSSCGICTLEDLKKRLQTPKRLGQLAQESGIGKMYLTLLLRVLNGYTPKPQKLALLTEHARQLEALGLKTSKEFWTAAHLKKDRAALAQQLGVEEDSLLPLVSLCDLCRLQWVSILFARLLLHAGFRSVGDIAKAEKSVLAQRCEMANRTANLFKGKIGERDMGRLIHLAALADDEVEL